MFTAVSYAVFGVVACILLVLVTAAVVIGTRYWRKGMVRTIWDTLMTVVVMVVAMAMRTTTMMTVIIMMMLMMIMLVISV